MREFLSKLSQLKFSSIYCQQYISRVALPFTFTQYLSTLLVLSISDQAIQYKKLFGKKKHLALVCNCNSQKGRRANVKHISGTASICGFFFPFPSAGDSFYVNISRKCSCNNRYIKHCSKTKKEQMYKLFFSIKKHF